MTATNDERAAAILSRLNANRQKRDAHDRQITLAGIMDNLNVWAVLESAVSRLQKAYGPRTLANEDGLRVVVWQMAGSYYTPADLLTFGVSVVAPDVVTVGAKRLPYTAPTYNPESYHKLMRSDYRTYHHDDATPPTEPLLSFQYDTEARLSQRARLAAVLTAYTPSI